MRDRIVDLEMVIEQLRKYQLQDVMKKTLLEQNAWLKDEKFRAAALHLSAASSSAVEGIYKPFSNDELPLNSVHYKLSVFAESRA